MSIYATLWVLRFPSQGDYFEGGEWVEVLAQSVPPHIGTPSPGFGYESRDPYESFLPAALRVDENGDAPFPRAVFIVLRDTPKGTVRSSQEYVGPLLALSGEEYAKVPFDVLHARICDRLRGNRPPVVAQVFLPSGESRIIRDNSSKQSPK